MRVFIARGSFGGSPAAWMFRREPKEGELVHALGHQTRLRNRALEAITAVEAAWSLAAGWDGSPSDGVGAALSGADPDNLLDILNPHLAVADPSGPRGADNRLDDVRGIVVVRQDLHADLRYEVDLVLRAAVHLGVAALASVALSV